MTEGLGNVQLNLVNSVAEAEKFISWLGERRPFNAIAVDIETGELPGRPRADALSPWHGRIRLVQVGDGQTGWSIPWDEWAGVFYEAMSSLMVRLSATTLPLKLVGLISNHGGISRGTVLTTQ